MADDKTTERYELRLVCIDGDKEEVMDTAEVPMDKLREQQVSQLPDREAMSLVNANLALPINVALAANVLSDNAAAIAAAQQHAPIDQGIGGGPLPLP
jgi:hypothetical protein